MAAEIVSLGQLSKLISNLKQRGDRKAIAAPFGLDERGAVSFTRHMSSVRNICAHHGRLWNRRLTVTMAVRALPEDLQRSMRGADRRQLHNTLVMLGYLLPIIAPGTQWRRRIVALVDGCPQADPRDMGFPADWRRRPVWLV